MREDGKITVFLLDDQEDVRRTVREALTGEGLTSEARTGDAGILVAGEAATVAEALDRIPRTQPDVAVLDVRLPDGSGIDVCREIRFRHPHIHCLMLTPHPDDEALFDAVTAGASGHLPKSAPGEALRAAVREVAAGRSLLDPAATQFVLERLRQGARPRPDERLGRLTEQERRILVLIGEGLTNRAIGERLHLAEKTVKNYVSGLLAKLGMERRAQAAAYVARLAPDQPTRHPWP
ncbi:response regulator transcription factor [Streptomyces sp. 549]|uniref:response regulator transcription factor n=1 Tax=Streptomyces sp. 549 TaxID=3049076 RepID=UPI0024C26F66|nr:response regulator transcription factor [Streptomyces sp. 549]MDK1473195.1 response regulator transcription factor [Streptomyces sp. 549]